MTTLAQLVNARVNASLAPSLAALKAQRKATAADYAAQEQRAMQIAQALAQLLKGTGPQVLSGYQNVAGEIGQLAKGFGGKLQQDATAEANADSDFLKNVAHAPTSQINNVTQATGGSQAGDVVYGLGGYIPARSLGEQGAAAAAAADMLPNSAIGRGQQAVQSLMASAKTANDNYDAQLAKLMAQVPSLRQSILAATQKQQNADRAYNLQADYLGLSTRKTNASLTGVDPVTGKPTYQSQKDAAGRAAKTAAGRRSALSQANKTALGIVTKNSKKTNVVQYVPQKKPKLSGIPGVGAYVKKGGGYTDDPAQAVWIQTGQQVKKVVGQRYTDDYYATIHQVEAAVTPILKPYGYSTTDIIKFAQRLVNQYYKAGQAGRPGAGGGKTRPVKNAPKPNHPGAN